jgi:signal transduction histidine kinase
VHEANNPLSIVRNYLHILELRMQQEPDAVEQIESIASEVQRASEIFARARDVPDDVLLTAPTGEVSEFELNALLTRLAELHRGLGARYGTEVLLDLSARDIVLRIDESRLTQIVTNLVKNAVEACSPGDTVTVGSRQPIYRDGRSGVEILVRDTGSGIPENVLASLGDGQRSEKGGEHQGLGLLVAFRLARELQGALDVRTRINEGTEFSLYLPDA